MRYPGAPVRWAFLSCRARIYAIEDAPDESQGDGPRPLLSAIGLSYNSRGVAARQERITKDALDHNPLVH